MTYMSKFQILNSWGERKAFHMNEGGIRLWGNFCVL